jgi:hypothetical protein
MSPLRDRPPADPDVDVGDDAGTTEGTHSSQTFSGGVGRGSPSQFWTQNMSKSQEEGVKKPVLLSMNADSSTNP